MGAKHNRLDLACFSTGFCEEDIDTGDLSRAGPAYEAMEDKNKTVATWSFDVHPLCGYISKKAKISKVNHGCKAVGKIWSRGEIELKMNGCQDLCADIARLVSRLHALGTENCRKPAKAGGVEGWHSNFKCLKSSPKNTCCGKCDQHFFRWLKAISIPSKF